MTDRPTERDDDCGHRIERGRWCALDLGHAGEHDGPWSIPAAERDRQQSISGGSGALDRCTCDGEFCGAWDECKAWAARRAQR